MKATIKYVLKTIKDHFGDAIFLDSKRFKAAVMDVSIEENAKAIRYVLCLAMCEMRVYTRLKKGFDSDNAFTVDNLIDELSREYLIPKDDAKMVIKSIAEALFGYTAGEDSDGKVKGSSGGDSVSAPKTKPEKSGLPVWAKVFGILIIIVSAITSVVLFIRSVYGYVYYIEHRHLDYYGYNYFYLLIPAAIIAIIPICVGAVLVLHPARNQSFKRSDFRQTSLSSLPGDSPPASSALSDENHPRLKLQFLTGWSTSSQG